MWKRQIWHQLSGASSWLDCTEVVHMVAKLVGPPQIRFEFTESYDVHTGTNSIVSRPALIRFDVIYQQWRTTKLLHATNPLQIRIIATPTTAGMLPLSLTMIKYLFTLRTSLR